jgi:hypothetical protein
MIFFTTEAQSSQSFIRVFPLLLYGLCASVVILNSCTNAEHPTFTNRIAPIIYKNCTPCHRKGEAGGYSFVTYEEVSRHADLIAAVTKDGYMPPWPADTAYSRFCDEFVLTQSELEALQIWAKSGAPLGDENNIPKPPDFFVDSTHEKPDLVLKMTESFFIKGDNADKLMITKLPYEIANDTFIRAIEFVPGNRKLLHHMNGHLISYPAGKKKNVFEGEHIVEMDMDTDQTIIYRTLGLQNDDGTFPTLTPSVINYLPGVISTVYPEGIGGYRMSKKGAFLLKDLHYGPTPLNDSDQSVINVYFGSKPPKRPVQEAILGTLGISDVVPPLQIPANERKSFYTEITTSEKISLLTVNPHMHLLGKSFKAYAVKPNGDTIPLININKWDFRWQYFYTYKKPVVIPKGSRIRAEAVFDNTSANANNPFSPPRQVGERNTSMRTTDEMFQFIITFLPYRKGDENLNLE